MKRALVLSVLGLVLLLAFGLPASARLWSASTCDHAYELQLNAPVDARGNGYLLPPRGTGHFRRAVYDLIQGRILFFELEESPGSLVRYALANKHSASCIERRLFDEHLAGLPMPSDGCISATGVTASASRYLIEGGTGTPNERPDFVEVRDRQSGALLAHYRRRTGILDKLTRLFAGAACGQASSRSQLPLWHITSFVFPDNWGETLDLSSLDRIGEELDLGMETTEVLPPALWVQRRLAGEGRLDRNSCVLPGWMGATEVHEITLEHGPLEVGARLDASSGKAGVVLLDVHAPDKAVILLARAQGPTIWHVHETSRSSVVAILVQAEHGQAVVGLSRFTRILMSTQQHNPYTNCTAEELRGIEKQVTARYGVTHRQRQSPRQVPPVARYSIGEPMPDGAQLFHDTRSLADFELREDDQAATDTFCVRCKLP